MSTRAAMSALLTRLLWGILWGDPLHFGAFPRILPHLELNKINTFARSHVHDHERIDPAAAARQLARHLSGHREQRQAGAARIDGATTRARVGAQARTADDGIDIAAPSAQTLHHRADLLAILDRRARHVAHRLRRRRRPSSG